MNNCFVMILMSCSLFSCATSWGMDFSKETEAKIKYLKYQAMTLDEKIAERIVELQQERSEMLRTIEHQAIKNEQHVFELNKEIGMLEGLLKPKAKL